MNITTKEISLQSVHQPIVFNKDFEYDEQIPDHLPNIKEFLYLDSDLTKELTSLENGKLVIEQTVQYKFYYISEQNDSLCIFPFTKHTVIKTDIKNSENTSYLINSFACSSQTRMLNPRKIFVKSTITYEIVPVEDNVHSVLSDSQEKCFTKSRPIASSTLTKILEEDFSIENEILLGDGYEPTGQIIDVSAKLSNYECVLIPSYCILKGTANLSLLYFGENDSERIIHLERTISFEKSIPCEHYDDGCTCFCKLRILENDSSPSIDAYGEYRVIKQKLDISATIFGISEKYESVVTDIFTSGKSEKTIVSHTKHTHLCLSSDNEISIDGIISTESISFSRIISANAKITLLPNQNEKSFSGTLQLNIIGETPNGLNYFCANKDFVHNLDFIPFYSIVKEPECNLTIAGGDSLSYRIHFKISSFSVSEEFVDMINSVEFTDLPQTNDHMVIYYPSQNEPIWDIAKKYHTSPNLIKATNPSFESECVKDKDIVIIKYN